LPFVMDAYGASRKSKLRVNVDPQVLQRALAQADLAETLVLSPITSDDQGAEPVVIHPDVVEPSEAMPEVAVSASEPEPEPEPVIPELPAVMGGIPPEEVAQREAEQFAKGLAQAQEEAAVQLVEAIEKAMAEGLSKGLEQGKTEGLAEGLAEGLQMGLEQGKAQGLAEGEQTARDAVAEEMAAQRVIFENVSSELGALIADPKKFFEPLKRLALHVAEQVVVGELETSSKAMERLVQRCLDELDHPVHGAVVLELNPDDKARLQAHAGDFLKGMRLEAVHDMKPGSVRVFANDTVVEDLVAHRLEGLARALLVDVEAWREKSPLAQRILEVSEEAEGGDVHS
jgi:flagellar biosynthesis/type III secretory pathway protein FliH